MTPEKVAEAEAEAKRFLKRAEAFREEIKQAGVWNASPKTSGALRRSSMELTRSLAEMRRP